MGLHCFSIIYSHHLRFCRWNPAGIFNRRFLMRCHFLRMYPHPRYRISHLLAFLRTAPCRDVSALENASKMHLTLPQKEARLRKRGRSSSKQYRLLVGRYNSVAISDRKYGTNFPCLLHRREVHQYRQNRCPYRYF